MKKKQRKTTRKQRKKYNIILKIILINAIKKKTIKQEKQRIIFTFRLPKGNCNIKISNYLNKLKTYKMLVLSTIILLISNALTTRREMTILLSRSVMYLSMFFPILIYANSSFKLLENGISLYSGLFFVKPYISLFTLFIFLLTSLILGLTSFYPRKKWQENFKLFNFNLSTSNNIPSNNSIAINNDPINNKNLEQYKLLEYSLLILFVLNGASLLMSSNDLISIFLCLELQSYGLYLLCAVYRDSELSSKAALTYFLLGGLSSCIILLGQSLIYINTGTTNLDGLYIISNISEQITNTLSTNSNNINQYQYYIQTSLVIFSVGFLFKISSAPFHNWSPDVYDQIPTLVTTFVAIIAKISILIMLLELVCYTSSWYDNVNISWKNSLLLSALLSLVIGSVLGLTQSRIKRLYAYSTISHLGFILLSLSIISVESTMAFFFYIVQYSITNLNAFLILIAIGYSLFVYSTKQDKDSKDINSYVKPNAIENEQMQEWEKNRNYSPVQYISELTNYYKINTYLALSLALTLFSFLGVPPLIGFFGKQMVLSAALDRGYVFMVLIAILTSVISAVYYLIIIKVIFFGNEKNSLLSYANSKKELIESMKDTNASANSSQYILFDMTKVKLNSFLTNAISLINLIILDFVFFSKSKISLFLILSLYQIQ